MSIFSGMYETWRDVMDNKSDQRMKDWFLMSSPFPTLVICLAYAYFVKVLGPKLMEDRKPFKLKTVLIVYNFLQVLFSAWLFNESAASGWLAGYNWRCQPYDSSSQSTRMVIASWWYFISKFTEFMDTFFFIMRKRYDQVSVLHVIHHGIMPFSVWCGIKFTPGGHASFFAFLNTFVHIIMYTYYMFAAMGPKVQKYLWWKKYLTILQLIQFMAVGIHAFQLLLYNPCQYPMTFVYVVLFHAIMFWFLFKNFYNQTYIKKTEDGTIKKTDGDINKSNTTPQSSTHNYGEQERDKMYLDVYQKFVCQNVSAYEDIK